MGHDSLRVPIAIVIAGALVALGVYFGLRDQRTSPAAGAAITAGASSVGAVATPPVATTPAAPPSPRPEASAPPPASRDAVAAAVTKALDAMRADLVAKCWEPHVRAHPGAKAFKIRVNVSLGPDGKQVARGISEDRSNERSSVGMCVTRSMPAIEIAPPGGPAFVEVPFSLP